MIKFVLVPEVITPSVDIGYDEISEHFLIFKLLLDFSHGRNIVNAFKIDEIF